MRPRNAELSGGMDQVLLIEASATRRRALSGMLAQRHFEVIVVPNFAEALALLAKSDRQTYAALIVSWPEYSDHRADEVFALLRARDWFELPVLVMADSTDAGAVTWLMKRPATALLLWSDYSDASDALDKLIRPTVRAAPPQTPAPQSLRVLFVDDSPTVRIAFKRLLTAEGFQVETAINAEDGLAKALAGTYDIAIVDYFMPGENGSVLVRQLRDHTFTSHILSAIITGTYSDRVITESLGAGAVECMFKSEARELFLARMRSMSRTVNDRNAIDNERRRLHGILMSVGEGVYGVDSHGLLQFINPAAMDILGYPHEVDFTHKSAADLFHYAFEDRTRIPRQACYLSQCYERGDQMNGWQTVFWHESGRSVPVECTVYPLDIDGKREGAVVAFRDVSQRRLLEEELRWQASHDALTKLHNRAYFEQQLQQEVARLRRSDQNSLLLFVDVDRFKYINDTLGHAAGDHLLIEASHRLRSRLRVNDTLARMGGDEYALILRNSQANDPLKAAEDFRKALSGQLFSYGDKHYRITASIGVAIIDKNVMSPSEVMANADIACHIAKNTGRNQVHVYSYDTDQRASMDIELNWSARLEVALRENLFVLCFQPILPLANVDLNSLPKEEGALWLRHLHRQPPRRIFYEVLIRMVSAGGEYIAPDAFLPTAERYNMMLEIDKWVINNAFRALRDNQVNDPHHLIGLSINLSAQSLGGNGIGRFVMDKLVEFNVDPTLVTFEITETKAVTNLDAARELIAQLRGMGCRFALDDFGCGFSSFTHLKHLDVDFLKIDGSFIQGLLDDPVDRAVITAINDIAHSVGKRTVAECVDRPDVLAALRACGVDFVQGYYVGRPTANLGAAFAHAQTINAELPYSSLAVAN